MGVYLDATAMRRELALRGVGIAALADAAGLSRSTITRAMAGGPMTPRGFKQVIQAIALLPRVGTGRTGIDDAAVERLLATSRGRHRRTAAAAEPERKGEAISHQEVAAAAAL